MSGLIEKGYREFFWRLMRNRSGYSEAEIAKIRERAWAKGVSTFSRSLYWFRMERVETNRCTVGWKQGDRLYFGFLGMLIRRKAPKTICPHAVAAISPVIYACLDRMGRGADPAEVQVQYVNCTDPGFDQMGLGNNLMRVHYERMPPWNTSGPSSN